MLTRSLPSVARATVQPEFGVADDVLVGDEHVVEEHLVEFRAAGDLAQRPHLDLGCLHVDDHRRDARRASGLRGRCARWPARARSSAPRWSTPFAR